MRLMTILLKRLKEQETTPRVSLRKLRENRCLWDDRYELAKRRRASRGMLSDVVSEAERITAENRQETQG